MTDHRASYEIARQITKDWGLRVRVVFFALFGLNAWILWVALPGYVGLTLGGALGAFTGVLILGEAWRQFQIHVLGYSAGPVLDEEGEA